MKVMSNFSFKHFDSDELPFLFDALKQVFDTVDVPFYLIGARAEMFGFYPKNLCVLQKI